MPGFDLNFLHFFRKQLVLDCVELKRSPCGDYIPFYSQVPAERGGFTGSTRRSCLWISRLVPLFPALPFPESFYIPGIFFRIFLVCRSSLVLAVASQVSVTPIQPSVDPCSFQTLFHSRESMFISTFSSSRLIITTG